MNDWMPEPSDSMATRRVIVFVPLLVLRGNENDGVHLGYYLGEPLNEWRIMGSPSSWEVSHWQAWPEAPRK
jgi:hypothetical protein